MVIRFVMAATALLAASQARAEQVKICEQTVDYTPTGVPSPEINGVWEGTIDWGIRYQSCHGFVVEGLGPRGGIRGQQAWNHSYSANSDVRNAAYMGKAAFILLKQPDGTYHDVIGQPDGTFKVGKYFKLRLEGNKLVGKHHSDRDSGDHDVVFWKR
jgi:hypothetical protein